MYKLNARVKLNLLILSRPESRALLDCAVMKSLDRPRAAPFPAASHHLRALLPLSLSLFPLVLAACGAPASPKPSPAIRLVDLFESTQVERAASAPAAQRPRTEWR